MAEVYGFDEFAKKFKQVQKRYVDEEKTLLVTAARLLAAKIRANTPVGEGNHRSRYGPHLKNTWRQLKLKVFPDGTYSVRVQSSAKNAHWTDRGFYHVKAGRHIPGKFMLEIAAAEVRATIPRKAQDALNKVCEQSGVKA